MKACAVVTMLINGVHIVSSKRVREMSTFKKTEFTGRRVEQVQLKRILLKYGFS